MSAQIWMRPHHQTATLFQLWSVYSRNGRNAGLLGAATWSSTASPIAAALPPACLFIVQSGGVRRMDNFSFTYCNTMHKNMQFNDFDNTCITFVPAKRRSHIANSREVGIALADVSSGVSQGCWKCQNRHDHESCQAR